MQDLGLVPVPRRGRAVRVQHQRPALPVNDHLVMERAKQYAAGEAGVAAVGRSLAASRRMRQFGFCIVSLITSMVTRTRQR
jgi:hypothetical protein